MIAILTGLLAGAALGAAMQRSGFCTHAAYITAGRGDTGLMKTWAMAVAVGAVGLTLLFGLPGTDDLNRGLAFRPVSTIGGGLVVGLGLVVAASCIGGLFWKFGTGMLGAGVGLTGWVVGELLARQIDLPGPTLLGGGTDSTWPGVLNLPRWLVVVAVVAAALIWAGRPGQRSGSEPEHSRRPRRDGLAIGAALTAAWALAAVGDARFGPSSVGAVSSVADGDPAWWLIASLVGLIIGGFVAAKSRGEIWVRGESRPRYLGLGVGGVLLGAGGWWGGGCTLGHGLSGLAQLNVASVVSVAAMGLGVALACAVRGLFRPSTPRATMRR